MNELFMLLILAVVSFSFLIIHHKWLEYRLKRFKMYIFRKNIHFVASIDMNATLKRFERNPFEMDLQKIIVFKTNRTRIDNVIYPEFNRK